MRYFEIVEAGSGAAGTAKRIWDATKKTHAELRKLHDKQQDAADARASARSLPAGAERARRLRAAERKDAQARRTYGAATGAAHDAINDALADRSRDRGCGKRSPG